MRPLPAGGTYQRTPSGYWKVVGLADGRISAFLFDQATPRSANYCDARVTLLHVELRSRLYLLPDASEAPGSLDTELGCDTPPPADPAPDEIPAERARSATPQR